MQASLTSFPLWRNLFLKMASASTSVFAGYVKLNVSAIIFFRGPVSPCDWNFIENDSVEIMTMIHFNDLHSECLGA